MADNNNIEITEAILIAYINDELTSADRHQVEIWLDTPANRTEFEKSQKVWEASKNVDPQPVFVNTDQALQKVLAQIEKNDAPVIPIDSGKNSRRIFMMAAAVIFVLFGVVGLMNVLSETNAEQLELTAGNSVLEDKLSDGTLVSLNENSMLTYPEKFENNERRVKLSGEAFFDVERNEEKPFIIDLHNDFYVRVLGTSFNIDANENDTITTVYVKSGKVEFGSTNNKVTLVAGEKGIMNNETGEVEKIQIENGDYKELYWRSEELNFDHVKLSETLKILEDVFDANIELHCEGKGSAQVVSHHQHETLDGILEVIASLHQLKISKDKSNYILECAD